MRPPEAFTAIVRRRCASCDRDYQRKWRGEDYRYINIRGKYGIGKEECEFMLEEQGGVCAICGSPPHKKKWLDIDHDHSKKKKEPGFIRALLCCKCNMGIGHFNDDIYKMLLAVEYLKKHRDNPRDKKSLLTDGKRVLVEKQKRLPYTFARSPK